MEKKCISADKLSQGRAELLGFVCPQICFFLWFPGSLPLSRKALLCNYQKTVGVVYVYTYTYLYIHIYPLIETLKPPFQRKNRFFFLTPFGSSSTKPQLHIEEFWQIRPGRRSSLRNPIKFTASPCFEICFRRFHKISEGHMFGQPEV